MPENAKTSKSFPQWYEGNRDVLNQRRRQRYATDPEYRRKVRGWNEDARKKRKEEMQREEAEVRSAVKLRATGTWKTVLHEVDGVQVPMFTIGALAKVLGKGISTIRVWERTGVLPETPYRSTRGDRLYTTEMVEQLEATLRRAGRVSAGPVRGQEQPEFVVKLVRFPKLGESLEMRLYKVGTLAKAVGKTVTSLNHMEKKGALPRTPLVASALEYRLYTLDMIEVVQRALRKRGGTVRGEQEWGECYDEIAEEWRRLGIMDAEVVE